MYTYQFNNIPLSFTSAKVIHSQIELLPSSPQWSYKTVPTLVPTKDDVILYYRDPIECLKCLFSNPLHQEHIELIPYHCYTLAEKTNRVYSEWMSGDVAWQIQVSLSYFSSPEISLLLVRPSYWRNTSWCYSFF